MPRKTIDVTIADEGRDKGKTFLLTEMPAARAEKWAMRALLLAAQSGAEVEPNLRAGMAGVAVMGIETLLGGVSFDGVEPLLDEMMTCVQIKPDRMRSDFVRKLVEDDIEEVATRVYLRQEVFALHVGFSFADALSTLKTKAPADQKDSQNTETSPPSSGPSSPPESEGQPSTS